MGTEKTWVNALVTGGGGFLGSAIVRHLHRHGSRVTTLNRRHYPHLDHLDVNQFSGDITDYAAVKAAAKGCDIIFHVAAKAGIWGDYADYRRCNVVGTQNVIKACRELGITRLVYTSSPSVVFAGDDIEGGDESLPYPRHYETAYPATKAEAERLVIAANDATLHTVSLRPHLIWGPGDNHLVPRIIAKGKAGKLRRIGSANKLVDCVYVDNAAAAHVLAAQQLDNGKVAGKCYFISQDEPRPLWDIVNDILACADIAPVEKKVPFSVAYTAGFILEQAYRLLGKNSEPPMTRFLARELATAHWFNVTAARRDFGYSVQISYQDGMKRLKQWLQAETDKKG